jgi:hypothetical protein
MQSYNVPFKISDIDFENIVYKDIKSNSKKTVVFLKYKKKNSLKNLAIQTPTFLNINSPVKNGNHWNLEVPLHGKKNNKVNDFVKFLKKLDEKIIYDARINSSRWFENFDSEEINYQEIIRTVDDKRYTNGMIRLKLIKNNDFQTMIQLNNKDYININEVPKNSWVKMIIEIHAIWINKNGFGIFLKPILISFSPIEINRYKFIEDSEDDVDDVIDSESIFIKSTNNIGPSDMETSHLKLDKINDSLELQTNTRFSSTSSNNNSSNDSSDNDLTDSPDNKLNDN